MGWLLPTTKKEICVRLHSRGLGAGMLNIPFAEASRPFSELRLLNSAVVSVQAVKAMMMDQSQYGWLTGADLLISMPVLEIIKSVLRPSLSTREAPTIAANRLKSWTAHNREHQWFELSGMHGIHERASIPEARR